MKVKTKIITWTSIIIVLSLAVFIFFRFFFVYSSGVNTGDLNYFQKQGVVFKTYEGKIIQTGIKSGTRGSSGIKSNELKFSVTDDSVAAKLMRCSGKEVELHWNRYLGTLPWRGASQYVVDQILSIKDVSEVRTF